jgi:hypothetical protein
MLGACECARGQPGSCPAVQDGTKLFLLQCQRITVRELDLSHELKDNLQSYGRSCAHRLRPGLCPHTNWILHITIACMHGSANMWRPNQHRSATTGQSCKKCASVTISHSRCVPSLNKIFQTTTNGILDFCYDIYRSECKFELLISTPWSS